MALILTRRSGESVKIGDNVTMTVREVHPKKIYVVLEKDGIQQPEWLPLYSSSYLGGNPLFGVEVTGISGRQVRLAFEADKSVKIMRTELLK